MSRCCFPDERLHPLTQAEDLRPLHFFITKRSVCPRPGMASYEQKYITKQVQFQHPDGLVAGDHPWPGEQFRDNGA